MFSLKVWQKSILILVEKRCLLFFVPCYQDLLSAFQYVLIFRNNYNMLC